MRAAQLNETLEAKVRARTRQLHEANQELEAFSYSVSHDLRAPLRGVDGFGRMLLRDYPGKVLDEKGVHYIQRMGAATVRMGQLIEDLLNLSQVSRTRLQKQLVDLGAIVQELWLETSSQDSSRSVEISIACDVQAYGDPNLLRIALENLLGNAWKFTSNTADARVTFECERRNGEVVYAVGDNGAGFDMAHAEQLFAPFQRLHSEKEFGGTGIGLAIVQRIVHRHGGRIWAEGEKLRGARFLFTLGDMSDGQMDAAD
jgi:light-regulated signal transduction histidine kinase (bacteriophytochrome)